jgi:hypothetical protein
LGCLEDPYTKALDDFQIIAEGGVNSIIIIRKYDSKIYLDEPGSLLTEELCKVYKINPKYKQFRIWIFNIRNIIRFVKKSCAGCKK